MRHTFFQFIFAALCVFQLAAAESKWNRRSNLAGKAFEEQDLAPSPRLRQTTWKEIHARRVSRTSPSYKRQMASAVPSVYPTCSVASSGTLAVARYAQTEITGVDAYTPLGYQYGYLNATSESDCLRQCKGVGDCIGYFYRADSGRCYLKASWTSSSFSYTSAGATSTGAVSGLLGTCATAASAGAPSIASSICCDAKMAISITYPTCAANYTGSIAVARYLQTDYLGGNSVVAPGPFTTLNEAACLRICKGVSDCIGYAYSAARGWCDPKSSLTSSSLWPGSTDNTNVVGVLGACSTAANKGVTAGCCDSKMTNPGFPTCPKATTGGLVVARYRQVELLANDIGPTIFFSEAICAQKCKSAAGCIGYFYKPSTSGCKLKSGFTSTDFSVTSADAVSVNSVTGLMGTCIAAAVKGVSMTSDKTTDLNSICCDAMNAAA